MFPGASKWCIRGVRDGTLQEDSSRARKGSAAEVMASRGDMIAFVFHRLGHNSAAAAKRHETRCATSRSPARSCHSQSEYEIALIRYLTADIEYDDAVDDQRLIAVPRS